MPDDFPTRLFGTVALGLAVICAAVLVLGRGQSAYEVTLVSANAGQLVKGNLVKVGGAKVGTVSSIALGPDSEARITLKVTERSLTPLHAGTRATIRVSSLSSVAGRYVALTPGPNDARAIPTGATLPESATQAPVDLDAVLSTFDSATRESLQALVHGASASMRGRAADANRALELLNPTVGQTAALARELNADQPALARLLVSAASITAAVDARRQDLDGALVHTATVARGIAQRSDDLATLLSRAPQTLRRASTTLASLQPALTTLTRTAEDARPVAGPLSAAVAALGPAAATATPAIREVRSLLPVLRTVLAGLPAVDAAARPAFSSTVRSLSAARPIIDAAVAYAPDLLLGLTNGFGGNAGGHYDANGQFLRIRPMEYVGADTSPGLVQALAPGLRAPGVFSGHTNRCPGGATQPAPDRSNPVVPPGVACDPRQAP
ncbi:MAG: hypothetical protein JWN65_3909 [Solirubrobacterales bacterium]|nr:hypothetical protein [Solirubrobacterales bacterium]